MIVHVHVYMCTCICRTGITTLLNLSSSSHVTSDLEEPSSVEVAGGGERLWGTEPLLGGQDGEFVQEAAEEGCWGAWEDLDCVVEAGREEGGRRRKEGRKGERRDWRRSGRDKGRGRDRERERGKRVG